LLAFKFACDAGTWLLDQAAEPILAGYVFSRAILPEQFEDEVQKVVMALQLIPSFVRFACVRLFHADVLFFKKGLNRNCRAGESLHAVHYHDGCLRRWCG
jgi:hypothetical protein